MINFGGGRGGQVTFGIKITLGYRPVKSKRCQILQSRFEKKILSRTPGGRGVLSICGGGGGWWSSTFWDQNFP